ncbi:MAG: tRNA (cytidine(34)-2'-O)-methyltransferase [Lachnospiraceae bacterium]|nr:tRNA (cytidine(34)-2'-O)-methyltransferase [Lachnospiraceae bacterium]
MPGIVLHEPEIPYNTGNIGRTCLNAGASLHLIEPLGFFLDDRSIKRAGLDYWDKLDVTRYMDYAAFLDAHPQSTIWYATTKARRTYADVAYGMDDFILFGKESAGIPEEILKENEARCIRIPMTEEGRSLNLCNSVAIILYELLRQNRFKGLKKTGALHHLSYDL